MDFKTPENFSIVCSRAMFVLSTCSFLFVLQYRLITYQHRCLVQMVSGFLSRLFDIYVAEPKQKRSYNKHVDSCDSALDKKSLCTLRHKCLFCSVAHVVFLLIPKHRHGIEESLDASYIRGRKTSYKLINVLFTKVR